MGIRLDKISPRRTTAHRAMMVAAAITLAACQGPGAVKARLRGPDPPAAGADAVGPEQEAALARAAIKLPGLKAEDLLLVPAGAFTMGSDDVPDEAPRREVTLPGFFIERGEATVARFAAFVAQGGHAQRKNWSAAGWAWRQKDGLRPHASAPARHVDLPVVMVSQYEAEALCRHAGRRLPTEEEWEKAARGSDGRRFPWGDDADPTRSNHWHIKHAPPVTADRSWPAVSAMRGVSTHGALHMAGNVWEWTASPFTAGRGAVDKQPWRVIRGGDWTSLLTYQRTSHREPAPPQERRPTLGFRCAMTAPATQAAP